MQREEGYDVGNGLDRGRDVGNGLDRGRVDVVVDDRTTRMQTDNHKGHGNHKTTITHSTGCCSGMRTGNHIHNMGHDLGASARDYNVTMPDVVDNTINNIYCCCRRNQHT